MNQYHQKEAEHRWGYWQGKDCTLGLSFYESRTQKIVRRGIASVLIAGILVGATYAALGTPNLLTLLGSRTETTDARTSQSIDSVVMQR